MCFCPWALLPQDGQTLPLFPLDSLQNSSILCTWLAGPKSHGKPDLEGLRVIQFLGVRILRCRRWKQILSERIHSIYRRLLKFWGSPGLKQFAVVSPEFYSELTRELAVNPQKRSLNLFQPQFSFVSWKWKQSLTTCLKARPCPCVCAGDSNPSKRVSHYHMEAWLLWPWSQPASPECGDGSACGMWACCLTNSRASKQHSRLLPGLPKTQIRLCYSPL